ncbi:MAG: tetratricopeptide repeat-containing protein [Richelia sp. RM1_1_1]|nr:tetratricopeptide repeat-containing protein [Richelia sp. RM1_1_1]
MSNCQKIGWHKGEASTLHNIAEAYRNLGEYDKALNYFQQSLAIYKQYGDEDDGIGTLNN